MIEGFKLKVSSAELRDHCVARSEYHDKRASKKEEQLPELRKSLKVIKDNKLSGSVSNMNKGGYHLNPDDPVNDLEQDIAEHRNKALVFRFFSEHLFDSDYTLSETDLVRLEIVKR